MLKCEQEEPEGHQEGHLPLDPNLTKEFLGYVQCLLSVYGRFC